MSKNPKNKTNRAVLVREGRADFEKLFADSFPVLQTQDAGSILEATDTGDRWRWSGTAWIQVALEGAVLVFAQDFYHEVAQGNVPGHSIINKYGVNPDIDIASGFEAIWNGGGDYTGHDATAAETIEVFSSDAADAGTLLSSGTATGGSRTSLIDTSATFVTDGGAIGDVLINDTNIELGIITAITETTLAVITMSKAGANALGDSYRVATKASTGCPVVHLLHLLDGDFANETEEYVITNGVTAVDTVGTYRRNSRLMCHGGTNAGTITTRQKTTTANIFMLVPIGNNSSMVAAYTIPADKRAFFTTWFAGKAKKQASFSIIRLMIKPANDVYRVLEENTISSTGTSAIQREYKAPKAALFPGTDVKIMADTDTNDNGVAAGFDLILIDL